MLDCERICLTQLETAPHDVEHEKIRCHNNLRQRLEYRVGVTGIGPALLLGRANEVTALNDDCCYLVFYK